MGVLLNAVFCLALPQLLGVIVKKLAAFISDVHLHSEQYSKVNVSAFLVLGGVLRDLYQVKLILFSL